MPISSIQRPPDGVATYNGWSKLHVVGPATYHGQSKVDQRPQTFRQWHLEVGSNMEAKYVQGILLTRSVDPTFDQFISKYMNKKVILHNRPTKQSKSSTVKKWSIQGQRLTKPTREVARQMSSTHLWYRGSFHLSTHRWCYVLLTCGIVRWWIHITCIVRLLIQARSSTTLLFFTYWSDSHCRRRCNPKWPFCIRVLLNGYTI
jgi:hypothetical protein